MSDGNGITGKVTWDDQAPNTAQPSGTPPAAAVAPSATLAKPATNAAGITGNVTWDDEAPAATPTSLKKPDGYGALDIPKNLVGGVVHGLGSLVKGAGELVDKALPTDSLTSAAQSVSGVDYASKLPHWLRRPGTTVGDAVGGLIQKGGDAITNSESDAAKATKEQSLVEGDLLHPSTWQFGEGAASPMNWALKGANMVGEMAPMVVGSELAGARALTKAPGVTSEIASAIKAGRTAELAPEGQAIAQQAAAAQGRGALAGGAVSGGLQGAEDAAQGESDRVTQMSDEDLAKLPAYQQMVERGMSPDDARSQLAQQVREKVFGTALPLATAAGGVSALPLLHNTQGVLSKVVGDSTLKRMATGAALEAPVQGAAAVGQTAAEVAAANSATGEQRDPLADSLATFGAGAAPGAAFGVLGGLHKPATLTRPRFEDAQPGSLSDAANAIHESQAAAAPDTTVRPAVADSDATGVKQAATPAASVQPIVTADDITARAQRRLDALNRASEGVQDEQRLDSEGKTFTIPGKPRRDLTDAEKAEQAFLTENAQNPQALAQRIGAKLADDAQPADGAAAQPTEPQSASAADGDAAAGAGSEPQQSAAAEPPSVPWVDKATGEMRTPTSGELTTALADRLVWQYNTDGHMRVPTKTLAQEWGVPPTDINDARKVASKIAVRRAKATDPTAVPTAPAAADAAPVEASRPPGAAARADTTASVPFMVTKATREGLRELGHSDADIAKMTPADALDTLKAGERVPQQSEAFPEDGERLAEIGKAADKPAADAVAEHEPAAVESTQAATETAATHVPEPVQEKVAASEADAPAEAAAQVPMAEKVEQAAAEAASSPANERPEPTDAQKEAGNYKKGHVSLHGMDISIENPRGSTRSGVSADGKSWSHEMSDHYGYIKRTEGADGDHVDAYIGPKPESEHVFVVDQTDQKSGGFDEHKVMLGYDSQDEAVAAYKKNFDPGWKVGPVHAMDVAQFKNWLKEGDTSKAMSEHVERGAPEAPKAEAAPEAAPAATIDDRIAEAERNGVTLSDADKKSIRESQARADEFTRRANQASGRGADPLNKGDAFPMGVGFTRMTKRKEQAIDASVRRAGEATKWYDKAKAAHAHIDGMLAGKGTEGERSQQEQRKAASTEALLRKILKGESKKLGKYEVAKVTTDKQGYPAALMLRGEGIIKGVNDRVDLARELFQGDKAQLRAAVDKIRGESTDAKAPVDAVEAAAPTPPAAEAVEPKADEPSASPAKAAEPAVPPAKPATVKRGGVTTSGALARVVKGKLEYLPHARETLEAYFQPGRVVKSYAGYDKVLQFKWEGDSRWRVQVQEVNKDGSPLQGVHARSIDGMPRWHSTFPDSRELLSVLGQPELAGKGVAKAKTPEPEAAKAAPEPAAGAAPAKEVEAAGEASPATEASPASAGAFEQARDVFKSVADGGGTVADVQAAFARLRDEKPAVLADLAKLTKDELQSQFGLRDDKKDAMVRSAYRRLLDQATVGSMESYIISGDYDTSHLRAVQAAVDKLTPEHLAERAKYVAEMRDRVAQRAAGVENPQTVEDYARAAYAKGGEENLSPEQRVVFDRLRVEKRAEDRAKETERNSVVRAVDTDGTGMRMVETKHTRDGHDLFVVKMDERVERDVYNQLNSAAKQLGGRYSSFKGNGAEPGFQFRTREAAEKFMALREGDQSRADHLAQRDEAKREARSETLAEKAAALRARGEQSLARDRKDNTRRRAAQAASAEAQARYDVALANTMDRIATAQADGTAGLLDPIRHRTQVDLLERTLKSASMEYLRDQGLNWEKAKDAPVSAEHLLNAKLPQFPLTRDQMVPIVRQLLRTRGGKQLGTELLKQIDYGDEYAQAVRDNPHKLLLRTTDGAHAMFPTKKAADAALARSGDKVRGTVVKMPAEKAKDQMWAVALAPDLAIDRKLWMPDSDKKVSINTATATKLRELLGNDPRESSLPYWVSDRLDKRADFARMGIGYNFELREALRQYLAMRDVPAGEDRVRTLERAIQGNKSVGHDFFPTPPALARRIADIADIQPGHRVLEPSAGKGDMADAVRAAAPESQIDTIEMSHALREILEAKGYDVVGHDFLEHKAADGEGYDRIVMNPPFSNGLDGEHVMHAYDQLKPGGRLVAITGEGIFGRSDKKAVAFRDWLEKVQGTDEKLPEGSFKSSFNPTGVNTRMVVVDKPGGEGRTRAAADSESLAHAYDLPEPKDNSTAPVANKLREVNDVVRDATAHWGDNQPNVRVVHSPELLPEAAKADPRYRSARGLYDGDTVYLVASNLRGREDVLRTLAHEAIGHYGMDRVVDEALGEGAWDKITSTIENLRQSPERASDAMRRVLSEVDRRYRTDEGPADPTTFAKEFMAVSAEKGVRSSMFDKVVAAVRAFVRKLLPNLSVGESELRGLLSKSEAFVRSDSRADAPQGAADTAPAFASDRHDPNQAVPVTTIPGGKWGEVGSPEGKKIARQGAYDYLEQLRAKGVKLTNMDTGWKIGFSGAGNRELKSWSATPERIEALAALPALMRRALLAKSEPATKGKDVKAYHYFYAPLRMGGVDHVARLVVREDTNGNYAYDLQHSQILDAKNPAAPDGRLLPAPKAGAIDRGAAGHEFTVARLKDAVNAVEKPGWAWAQGSQAVDTPQFRDFFGESKVVDKYGEPMPVYHGTAEDFSVFSPKRAGDATGHDTSALGHFFTPDERLADRYAENASDGRPADKRVVDAYLSIQNPYKMKLAEAQSIDSPADARAFRARLEREGYDGIHMAEANSWIAFHPEQIKSASENRGAFDKSNPNIYFSQPHPDADPDNPRPERKPAFANASASIEAIHAALPKLDRSTFQQAKDWLAGRARDFEPAALGALQLRHVLELAGDETVLQKPAKAYADLYQRMDGDRNSMTIDGAAKVDALNTWARQPGAAGWLGKVRPEAQALFKFMHAVTQLGVDPTSQYERLLMRDSRGEQKPWTKEMVKERINALRNQQRGRSGDDKTAMIEEIKSLRSLPAREKAREQKYPELVRQWDALTPEAQQHFAAMRDHYREQSEALEQATVEHLESLDIPRQNKLAAIETVRRNFADAKVDGVYFPLARFGDYWISAQTAKGEYMFAKYEHASDQQAAERQLLASGGTIEAKGRQDSNYRAKDAPSGTFMGDLMGILRAGHAPDSVQDQIYQMYLKTLPNMSLRKSGIHRSNVAGYTDDVPRVFASSVFHGAHQISKARYGWQLQGTLEHMRETMEARRGQSDIDASQAAHADALLGEIQRRHDWILNPTNSKLANVATSIGFSYYLAASPASALVNLIQVPQIVLPVLGAHHGWPSAMRVLGSTMKDAIRTGGAIERTLKGEELEAFRALQRSGTFQRTATHSLAGVAEGDALRSSPAYTRVMNGISWMFHKSEVINREGTGIAAFRLAREQGKSFAEAVKYADDMTNGTHGDYSNANRARYMQGNAQKMILQFKNYSLAMSWLWGRNFYKAFKGESPEIRSAARRTLTGLTGMTALFAGSMGLPMINMLRYGAQAVHAVSGDEDEPWDFDTEFRSWLADHLGQQAGQLVADGAVSQLGANVASRVSMSDLWFREPDKQLEGVDAYHNMLESIAGPLGGIVKNMYVGTQQFSEGHAERGIETMMPSFAKNAMKALRYAHEGVNTLRGDPIVPDVSAADSVVQALGFQPTKVAEQQRINGALMNYQKFIQDRRQALMNAFAMAADAGDDSDRADVLERIQSFNGKYPEIAIRMSNLQSSMRTRTQRSQQAENGIMLQKKLAGRVREEVGGMAGG
ncbi:PLxRFG domain-containing protein [Dyella japonica]|uniref:PLxRFG domain-containing protein n=1 Tax=Dyella japonica TaxID=231455 RepID=UPI00062D2132|nr:PLxRFG domain-containing protein [Dyella japonica]